MDSKAVFTSVAETKAQIEKYFYRVEVIERNLAFQEMSYQERRSLEDELQNLRDVLNAAQIAVKKLNAESCDGLAIGTLVTFFILSIYGLYRVFLIEHEKY
eukprot:GFUD01011364.1.p1 GENE.GFUD01011364.1~~GFUD01011364.1.p1  ORF type:complete len:101 (-),score=22.49 GFUD01011364.1:162-464(-)